MLCQILDGSQQLTLFPAVLLTLGKLPIAGVVGFPLALLIFLNLGIGSSLFLFDRLAHLPLIYSLLHQLHLVHAQDTIESICPLFRELAPFDVKLTGIVHAEAQLHPPTAARYRVAARGLPAFWRSLS